MRDTHLLTLLPATVDGERLTLNHLTELIQNPRGGGHATKYRYYTSNVKEELGDHPCDTSSWALMSKEVVPGSRSKSYKEQCALVKGHQERSSFPYEVPPALPAAIAILTHHVRSGERLYSDAPWTYTRCQEKVHQNRWPVAIGGFSGGGLSVVSNGSDGNGMAVFWKF